jgi:hypothetical protein
MTDENFLSRWSRRKSEARTATPPTQKEPPPAAPVPAPAPPEPLPPVESLTPESDFVPFMKADVDAAVKRQALKTLFQDPRFNVMDGLDVYIDDYSKPDPLPPGWLEKMTQTARLGEYREPDPEPETPKVAQPDPDAPAGAPGESAPAQPPDTAIAGTPPENVSNSGDPGEDPANISGVDLPQNKANAGTPGT